MKIIWTFTLLMIPGVLSSNSVTGYSGGVRFRCRYNREYTDNTKHFCRGQWSECTDQIRTNTTNKWFDSERFSLYDNKTAAVFTVTIRDLSEQDSGTYYCGTDIYAKKDSYTEVNLKVITADCCEKSISLSAAAGGSVNISCKYPQSHRADVKFICRRSGSDLCAEETSVMTSRRWKAGGQIQLYDDREQQLLTGIISHVTRHSAEYWCGVQSGERHKSFITRVLISVTETTVPSSSPPSSSPPLPSSSSASSFSSVTSPLISRVSKTSSSSLTSTGSSLIIPLVLVLLLLIIVGLLLLFFSCKKHQSRGGKPSSQAGAGEHGEVSHIGCDYEEIKDTHKQLPTNPSDSSNTIYATAQLPTTPSDSPNNIYATAQLPTNPSDSPNNIYATAQLPTNPSDSPNTVQKGTGDSQILITSAEDLNYSVVNFHKKADCPDRVRLRNNQDYSEYAAVNHLTA